MAGSDTELTLAEVLENIRNPRRWLTDVDGLIGLLEQVPSLRGMAYGNFAELQFLATLAEIDGVSNITRDDDHAKTKADRAFVFGGRRYTVQNKSVQTNLIRIRADGTFDAQVQNDASDRRTVTLPNGDTIETTCYVVGEYDILAVCLQPFTRTWTYAFKKNKDLRRSPSRKYTPAQRQYLLATLEPISYPLDESWTTDLVSLLDDPDLGRAFTIETATTEITVVDVPGTDADITVEEPRD